MNQENTNKPNAKRWSWRLAVLPFAGAALLFAGCGDDPEPVAAEERDAQTRTTAQSEPNTSSQLAGTAQQQEEEQQPEDYGMAPEGAEVRDSARVALKEEQLNVEKRAAPAGGVLLRKKVVTDDTTETVQLQQEEIEVVRLSPEEAREHMEAGTPTEFSDEMTEEEVFIPIRREEAVAQKEVETRGIVRAVTNTETREREIDATLRREELEAQRVQAGNPQQDQQQSSQQGEQASSQNEQELETAVRDRLRNDLGLSLEEVEQIEIDIEEGLVVLSGSAPSDEARAQIEEAIRNTEGVAMVQNDME